MRRLTELVAYNIEAVHLYGIDFERRTIYINPEDTEDDIGGIDQFSAESFIKNMAILSHAGPEPITIVLCTDGGSWDYGMAMFDAIRSCPCPTTTISYAHARSMSSIIPQAADHRVIMPNACFMMHWGTDGYEGVAHGLKPYSDFVQLSHQTMLDLYVERCKGSEHFRGRHELAVRQVLKEQMDRRVEWWLTAEEAVKYGFMDEVYAV